MPARASSRPRANHSGIHHLQSSAVLRALVRSAAIEPTDRVYDLGAGPGTITAALARTGAQVVAVERDPRFARELRRRFDGDARVRVVEADLRTVAVPRDARVVASIPFATSSALVARLLDPPGRPRVGADLIVEHGFARRLAGRPRSERSAWWAARYELRVARTVGRRAFAPAPAVDAALLRIRPREPLTADAERRLRALLRIVYGGRHARAGTVARRFAGRTAGPALLRAAGADPAAHPLAVAPHAWAAVAAGPRP
ncbi:rRNA adenine N(6)-methyltransferase family protein [Conexibacter arvalis]|uniref:23S rRNA (Adenine-N6)-dimethyltransferase n=1 Tax=Conexibacter arvalis TaxID=912552 RepID=A0A840I9T6_9ACTN|nr:rRNA adenine N(6)-methyltransferase family protein [Conexibacter arvalis]MBB4660690.1 23S rRNA (adenine-N6)-dimethyltransferase [Conexibacter arvalis]